MTSRRYLGPLVIIIAGAIILYIYLGVGASIFGANVEVGVYPGNAALDFSFTDFNGKSYRLSDFRGKVVLLEFMTSWCPACKVEHGHIERLYETYRDGDLVIITISIENNFDDAKRFWVENNVEWIMTWNMSLASLYGVYYIPTIIIIDRDGVIRFRDEGIVTYEELSALIDQYL